jgi:hypothetical protein
MAVEKAKRSSPMETIYFPKSPRKLLLKAVAVRGALWISDVPWNVMVLDRYPSM